MLVLLLAAIGLGALIGAMLMLFTLRERKRCGGCAFYDENFGYCWMKNIRTGYDDGPCLGYREVEEGSNEE